MMTSTASYHVNHFSTRDVVDSNKIILNHLWKRRMMYEGAWLSSLITGVEGAANASKSLRWSVKYFWDFFFQFCSWNKRQCDHNQNGRFEERFDWRL